MNVIARQNAIVEIKPLNPSLIADVAQVSGAKKSGQPLKVDRNSRLVAPKGVISNDLRRDLVYLINY